MERIARFTSSTIAWPADDVDTDQVIPARFLKGTARSGWGEHLFADRRYDAEGRPRPEFPLNRPEAKGARVLVAGRNFGCGSSREHAVWALQGYGFQAVIAVSFADIFRGNALKNGLLPVAVEESVHARVLSAPGSAVTVDLEAQKLTLADGTGASFAIDPFARYCLLNGIDELQFLLGQEEALAAYERRTGPLSGGIPS